MGELSEKELSFLNDLNELYKKYGTEFYGGDFLYAWIDERECVIEFDTNKKEYVMWTYNKRPPK